MLLRLAASLFAFVLLTLPSFADDWVAVKLRGGAESYSGSTWVTLKRGDVISDDRLVRTLADGHVDLQRGKEVITLGPNSQISIEAVASAAHGTTSVRQDFGTVEVEAEVQNVQHFTVRTKFLAAVVKGTHFIVTADDLGASVQVTRGLVAVEASESKHTTSVGAGYMASIAAKGDLTVSGAGPLPDIFDAKGVALPRLPALGTAGSSNNAPRSSAGGGSGSAGGADLQVADLKLDQRQPAATQTTEPEGFAWLPSAIGVMVGIALGAIALMFRRFFT